MNEARYRAVVAAGIASLLVLLPAGCQKRLPPETDPNKARAALTAALDAWKEGRPPESLRALEPPVDFRDTHWDNGSRLIRYRVKAEERSGVSVRFTVELSLQQKDGATRERVVAYNADAGQAVVIRPDF
jgi:hypothetical protein